MAALVNLLQVILMDRHINIPLPYTDTTRVGNRRWLARPDLTQSEANLPTNGQLDTSIKPPPTPEKWHVYHCPIFDAPERN